MDYETAVKTILPGRYRYFKGNEYEMLYIARHLERDGKTCQRFMRIEP